MLKRKIGYNSCKETLIPKYHTFSIIQKYIFHLYAIKPCRQQSTTPDIQHTSLSPTLQSLMCDKIVKQHLGLAVTSPNHPQRLDTWTLCQFQCFDNQQQVHSQGPHSLECQCINKTTKSFVMIQRLTRLIHIHIGGKWVKLTISSSAEHNKEEDVHNSCVC